MKYLLGNLVINAEYIVKAQYEPPHGVDAGALPFPAQCRITLASASANEKIFLHGTEAERFWEAYSSDAVVAFQVEPA